MPDMYIASRYGASIHRNVIDLFGLFKITTYIRCYVASTFQAILKLIIIVINSNNFLMSVFAETIIDTCVII